MLGRASAHVGRWLFAAAGLLSNYWRNPKFVATDGETKEETTTSAIDICLIHGTADRYGAFDALVPILLTNLPSRVRSISAVELDDLLLENDMAQLSAQVRAHLIKNNMKNVIFITHSRGGIVAAECVLRRNLSEHGIKTCGIISICPPWRGSPLALPPLTTTSPSIRQMQTGADNEYLAKLAAELVKSTIPVRYLAARHDVIAPASRVSPPEHKKSVVTLPDDEHLSIMSQETAAFFLIDTVHELVGTKKEKPIPDNRIIESELGEFVDLGDQQIKKSAMM